MAEQTPGIAPYDKIHKLKPLRLLVVVVNAGQSESITSILEMNESALMMILRGRGTASREVYQTIAGGELRKNVILAVIREDRWPSIKGALRARFSVSALSRGIAYTVPIDSVAGVSIYKMLGNQRFIMAPVKPTKPKKEKKPKPKKVKEKEPDGNQ